MWKRFVLAALAFSTGVLAFVGRADQTCGLEVAPQFRWTTYSLPKTGILPFTGGDENIYLRYVYTLGETFALKECSPGTTNVVITWDLSSSENRVFKVEYNPETNAYSTNYSECSGSLSFTHEVVGDPPHTGAASVVASESEYYWDPSEDDAAYTTYFGTVMGFAPPPEDSGTNSTYRYWIWDFEEDMELCEPFVGERSVTETASIPYDDDLLRANLLARLEYVSPTDWVESAAGGNSALYSYALIDGVGASRYADIQQAEFRFRIKGPKDAIVKVQWRQVDYDSATSSTTVSTNAVYVVTKGDYQMIPNTGEGFNLPPPPFSTTPEVTSYTAIEDFQQEVVCYDCGGSAGQIPGGGGLIGAAPGKGSVGAHFGMPQVDLSMGVGGFDGVLGMASLVMDGDSLPMTSRAAWKVTPDEFGFTSLPQGGDVEQFQAGMNVVKFDTNGLYELNVNFYTTNQTHTVTGGVYSFTGSPWKTFTILNPNGGSSTNTYLVIEKEGATSTTNRYTWNATRAGWELQRELKTLALYSNTYQQTTNHVQVEEIVSPSATNVVLRRVERHFTDYPWGKALMEERTGATNSYRWVRYGYDADGNQTWQIRDDGFWERTDYTSGLKTKVVRPFGNVSTNASENLCHVTSYDYSAQLGGDNTLFRPDQPRRIDEQILGTYSSLTFHGYSAGRHESHVLPALSSMGDTNIISMVEEFETSGAFSGQPKRFIHPDGTITLWTYSTAGNGNTTITRWDGAPDGGNTAVVDGTKLVQEYFGSALLANLHTYDVASNLLMDSQSFTNYDAGQRPGKVVHMDGSYEEYDYACCGLASHKDRDGVVTTFTYDPLGRQVASVRLGVTSTNVFDAAGNLLANWRVAGTNAPIQVRLTQYDLGGRPTQETNSLGGVTTHSWAIVSGQLVETTTYPDGGTRIEKYFQDGGLEQVTGTAVAPTRYGKGVEIEPGTGDYVAYPFETEIKLDASFAPTSEVVTNFYDFAGRAYKTSWAAASSPYPTETRHYNYKNQLWKTEDADGVTTLFTHDARGNQVYSALDVDRDGVVDLAGLDRVSRSLTDAFYHSGMGQNVWRTRTWAWEADNSGVSNLVGLVERSADGLQSWNTLTNGGSAVATKVWSTVAAGGSRQTTNFLANGATLLSQYTDGRLISVTSKDSAGSQTGKTTYGYDVYGRQVTATDARNGTTVQVWNSAGLVAQVNSPAPGDGGPVQTTANTHDSMGRVLRTTLPDGTTVTNEFTLKGEVRKVSGSRQYPVEYTYDPQGRMKTMKTWQNFAGNSGTATTTWNYDAHRGFLASKRYDNSQGPDYTYTKAGRLKTRVWARTGTGGQRVATTYKYGIDDGVSNNDHGDLVEVAHSNDPASTPGVATTYDRSGRQKTAVRNGMTTTWGRHWSGAVTNESYSSGTLGGLAVTNVYDSYLRRSSTQVAGKSATLNSYTYDNANRLATAGDGTYSATYSYLANSALAGTVTFKQSSTTRMTTRREYDLLNRLRRVESLSTATNTLRLVFDYQYNQANQRRRIDNGDGTHWVIEYDDLGQVVGGKKYWPDGSAVPGQQFEYDFDDIGNRTAHRYGGDATGQSSKLREVGYAANSLNQYTSRTNVSVVDLLGLATEGSVVTVGGSTNGVYRRGEYFHRAATNTANTWPSLTNVVSKLGTSVTNVGSIFIPPTPEAFTHDADGNLTQDGRWDYTWDGENRLIQVESKSGFPAGSKRKLEFEYDWQGRRIKKVSHSAWNGSSYGTVVTTKFIYDGWNLLAELDSSNNVIRGYVWGTDLSGTMQGAGGVGGLLFVKESDGTPHFAAYDGNGNVMGLVKGTDGTRTATYEYDPFGQPLRATGSMALANPMRFSTKFTDSETGLLYYGYRYYNPSSGRWASRDPIEEDGGMNLYAMIGNSAIGAIDYLGLDFPPGGFFPPGDPGIPDILFPAPVIPPDAKVPEGYRGFLVCQRPLHADDCIDKCVNQAGSGHKFIKYIDPNGKEEGWGVYRSGKVKEKTMSCPIAVKCVPSNGKLQYGKGNNGKTGKSATIEEIRDCLDKHPALGKYSPPLNDCRHFAGRAAMACGLDCKQ